MATLTVLALVGCGGGDTGPKRYNISGNVTIGGQPVANGTIFFEPENGEFGGGTAGITNGKYDTATPGGRGHSGGPHKIRIVASEPVEVPEDWKPPFQPYETTADLPAETSTKDFDIPAAGK